MYGLLLASIQHYIDEDNAADYGGAKPSLWALVVETAGLHDVTFNVHSRYPDHYMTRLARAHSYLLRDRFPTVDHSMLYFGRCFVKFQAKVGYDKVLRVAGRHYRDFLHGIDNLHETIRFTYPRMLSPSFLVEQEDRHGCVLLYRSARRGFSHYVMGQLEQCALTLYNVKVDIRVMEQDHGDPGCNVRYRLDFDNVVYCPPGTPSAIAGGLAPTSADRVDTHVPGCLLFKLIPFCIVFDKDLIIQRVGPGIANLLGERCRRGMPMESIFVLRRPLMAFTWKNIQRMQNVMFELEVDVETADTSFPEPSPAEVSSLAALCPSSSPAHTVVEVGPPSAHMTPSPHKHNISSMLCPFSRLMTHTSCGSHRQSKKEGADSRRDSGHGPDAQSRKGSHASPHRQTSTTTITTSSTSTVTTATLSKSAVTPATTSTPAAGTATPPQPLTETAGSSPAASEVSTTSKPPSDPVNGHEDFGQYLFGRRPSAIAESYRSRADSMASSVGYQYLREIHKVSHEDYLVNGTHSTRSKDLDYHSDDSSSDGETTTVKSVGDDGTLKGRHGVKRVIADPPGHTKTCKTLLKGQMKLISEWKSMAFLCTPLIANLRELRERNMYLNDLNMYDNSRDLVLQGNYTASQIEYYMTQQVATSKQIESTMKVCEEAHREGNKLVHSMLPEKIALRVLNGEETCQAFEAVTILFSNLVGFDEISNNAMDSVRVINHCFTIFDPIVDKHNLYKVETLGDAQYMVAGGVTDDNDDHAERMADLALDFIAEAHRVKCPIENKSLTVRIGIHTGSVVAGVIGKKTPQYCLFGDTVNTAARLQSSSLPGRVHLSQDCHERLRKTDFVTFYRGQIKIKGKGEMKSYWLAGRRNSESTLCNTLLFYRERDEQRLQQMYRVESCRKQKAAM